MRIIKLEIPFDPIPLARPKFSHGRAYLPPRSRDYRARVQDVVRQLMTRRKLSSLKGELICRLKFYRKFKPISRRFGDLDNLSKAILDAVNGLAFTDDAQITRLVAEKFTDKN